jgi:hypothetical protein
MAIYNVLRKTERFGDSFRVCDSKDAAVGSCDQFLTELSLRDCYVYTQRAYAIGLAHFFSWLHASGGDPDHVTRQIVGNYITEFARGARQGAVSAHSAQQPRQPRTINHRLSVLASYFEYCIRRDTEDWRGSWKGRINPASGSPLTEELRHGMIGRDLPARHIVLSTSSSGGGSPLIQRSGLMRATTNERRHGLTRPRSFSFFTAAATFSSRSSTIVACFS